jgi:hypothetical protein
MIALYATAAVRVALAIALAVAAGEVYNVFRVHAPGVSPSVRLALPVLFVVAAAAALRMGLKSVQAARAEASAPADDGKGPADAAE